MEPSLVPCVKMWAAGLQPVLVHMSKNTQGKFSFNPISVNFLVEVVKIIFAIIMLMTYVSQPTLTNTSAGLSMLQGCSVLPFVLQDTTVDVRLDSMSINVT